jgi:hypothetical protein
LIKQTTKSASNNILKLPLSFYNVLDQWYMERVTMNLEISISMAVTEPIRTTLQLLVSTMRVPKRFVEESG